VSAAEVAMLEREWGVNLPSALRAGFMTYGMASVFKDGEPCLWAVTGPRAAGGELRGYLQELAPFESLRVDLENVREWFEDRFETVRGDVFPFAHQPAGGELCLDYSRDPSRARPEVWEVDLDSVDLADAYRKVADDFDSLISMLVPKLELERMGFDTGG
jgi:hypothetical protein